jgi:hypothetical protein
MVGKIVSVLVIGIVVLSAYLLYLISTDPYLMEMPSQKQNNVVVSGVIRTMILTRPILATFTSVKNGGKFSTSINSEGYYSISLLGNDTYNIAVYYSGLFGNATSPNCDSHAISLNGSVREMNFTMNC